MSAHGFLVEGWALFYLLSSSSIFLFSHSVFEICDLLSLASNRSIFSRSTSATNDLYFDRRSLKYSALLFVGNKFTPLCYEKHYILLRVTCQPPFPKKFKGAPKTGCPLLFLPRMAHKGPLPSAGKLSPCGRYNRLAGPARASCGLSAPYQAERVDSFQGFRGPEKRGRESGGHTGALSFRPHWPTGGLCRLLGLSQGL